ncbi:MAG TPA: type II toxin-antitoxin system VapC family toxin [Chloroflexota bacterium]|nr:type II toxin-antitoxin system VapC family toxin [Chloroflexota bacterium]
MSTPTDVAGLLDTSAVLLIPDLPADATLPSDPFISTVTLAELAVRPLVARDESERARRQTQVDRAQIDFDVLPFDAAAALVFGRVSASYRRTGRKRAARAYDALIAATAIANDLPLYTCNPRDFDGIDGLDVRTVPLPRA